MRGAGRTVWRASVWRTSAIAKCVGRRIFKIVVVTPVVRSLSEVDARLFAFQGGLQCRLCPGKYQVRVHIKHVWPVKEQIGYRLACRKGGIEPIGFSGSLHLL